MRISDWSSDVCSSDLRPSVVSKINKTIIVSGPIVVAHLQPSRLWPDECFRHQIMDVRAPTFPLRGGHADHAISGFQPVKPQHSTFISSTHYLSVRPRHEYLSVQRTNRSSIGDLVKSLPPDYRAQPNGLTLPVPAAMPPGGLQRKTCRPIQQRRHERHQLVERARVFRPPAADLCVDVGDDRQAEERGAG